MPKFYDRQEAIRRMNTWGETKTPFLFFISYNCEECFVEPLDKIDPQEIRYHFGNKTNAPRHETPKPESFNWTPQPESFENYRKAFQLVYHQIHQGNSFLTNLTAATPVETDLTLLQIFEHAQAKYKLWIKDLFTVFSPEIFVRIADQNIYSYPMKGTINASLPNAESRLRNDRKEQAEHATITDLIRNDLSQIAEKVTVSRYAYIDRLETNKGAILQMSSEICGLLPDDFQNQLGTLFFRLLPAGSITGAPKTKTMQIISQAETFPRGFYTGVAGIWDGKTLDSAVQIRFLEQAAPGHFIYKSGGGITFQSDAQKEYEELIQKIYVPIY